MTTRMMLRPDFNETWEREHRHLLELLRERKKAPCRKFIGMHVEGSFQRMLLDQRLDDSEHPAEVAHSGR
jgi:DNA-binding GntR family transcriptional regulator